MDAIPSDDDVTDLACYIMYRKYYRRFRAKEQRKKFPKELANMLCMPSIKARSNIRTLMRNHFLRGAEKMVLGRRIVAPPDNAVVARAPHGNRGSTPIVGSCCVCRDQMRKHRKTRKSPVVCRQPVCNENSVSKAMCVLCESG